MNSQQLLPRCGRAAGCSPLYVERRRSWIRDQQEAEIGSRRIPCETPAAQGDIRWAMPPMIVSFALLAVTCGMTMLNRIFAPGASEFPK